MENQDASQNAAPNTHSSTLKGKKVFFVEDDLFFSSIITNRLVEEGCEVTNAASGEEAVEKMEKASPDVFIVDLLLPGEVTGFGVIEKIKSLENLKDKPVLIVSNLDQPEDIEKGMKLGVYKYLVKASVVPEEIIDYLSSAFFSKN